MTDPFNAQDPFDTTAENVLTMMCKSALSVLDTPECRELSPEEQFEALMCGMTTGILHIAFSCVAPEGRDEITALIKDYVDRARVQIESLDLAEEMAMKTPPPQPRELGV